ncbi:uncharacterized protein N7506_009677 [Penicillium brevicompactum]|uniref:uncharacterized protein n=1 Tax=Penicillium brevicompactum TaxID=5074 RepID=UPI002540B610|nr:uncharacterized protein N7506_009677 [Penicillium brevicompactum]KAJ5326575.1 hypothetical protein N7506_009677 [Penicillium brevicompactum]
MGESKTKTLLRGTRAILSYRRERDLLIKQVTSIIARLQTRPQGSDLVEITLNIGSLSMQANKVKWASENLTAEAKDMRYVTSQPYPDFFDKVIPKRCVQLSAVSKHYYHALVTHALHPIKRIEEIERTAAVDLHVSLANLTHS